MSEKIEFTADELGVIKQALKDMPDFAALRECQLSALVEIERQRALNRLENIPDIY